MLDEYFSDAGILGERKSEFSEQESLTEKFMYHFIHQVKNITSHFFHHKFLFAQGTL